MRATNQSQELTNWFENNKKSYSQQLDSLQQKHQLATKILKIYTKEQKSPNVIIVRDLTKSLESLKEMNETVILTSLSLPEGKQQDKSVINVVLEHDGFGLLQTIEDLCTYIAASMNSQEIRLLLESYCSERFDFNATAHDFRYCCDGKMVPDTKNQELICLTCGRTRNHSELIFEKKQFSLTGDVNISKSNKYNPMRNFSKWMDKISCRDDKVPEEILLKILAKFERDFIGFKRGVNHVSVDQIRSCLKHLKLTNYNTHIAYIRSYLTLQNPPQFSEADIRMMQEYYSKIIHIYYSVSDKYNIPYCPHMIVKIVENLFPDDEDKKRISEFVHFQNHVTIWKFNKIWKQICARLDNFIYTPLQC